ncbi:MAG: hypothetical protein IPK63_12255 [Candidatus Competibacteraceae bacterium]|nr:hypothetical protein [Candidatus Competibacteraceae bacterium]
MAALSVRVSEDPARPLGHAIVTLGGLPPGLETFEFALSRHGFGANHLGSDGWQGAECWLQPEEAWFSGELLKFVIHPDLVFQLENMPYQLTVRGQGLTATAAVTFVWPLQLELEEGSASGERKVVSGTRVNPAPAPRPQPEPAEPMMQPPPLPDVGKPDLAIPEMPIPALDTSLGREDGDQTQQWASRRSQGSAPPATATGVEAVETQPPPLKTSSPAAGANHKAASGESAAETEPWLPISRPSALPDQPPLQSEPPLFEPAGTPSRRKSGLLMGLGLAVVLVALATAGWWWFSQQANDQSAAPGINEPVAPTRPAAPVAPIQSVPKPAPEPIPAPEPKPASEPIPAPEPKPASEPIPAPKPSMPIRPVPSQPIAPERLPAPSSTPLPPTRPVPPASPLEGQRPAPSNPAGRPSRPGSDHSLEEELNSQFDPTQQELEKRLRSNKSP